MLSSKFTTEPPTASVSSAPFRFRVDNWLSEADANLLLKKQADLAAQQKDYDRALQLMNRLVAYEPNEASHYNNRGLIHYAIQDWKAAEADYTRAIELNPELDRAYNNRANLYARQHEWADAIADYDTAIDFNPLNVRARINQAITFREMSECEEALCCLDIALILVGSADEDNFLSASIYAERGRTHHLQGGWNCAIADYRKALSLSQNKALTHRVNKWQSGLTQLCV